MEQSEINNICFKTMLIDKCRACESQRNLFNLYENAENLLMKFKLCTSLEVNINDELPTHICKECLNELNIAYIFRMKCEKTHYKLLKLLDNKEEKVIDSISKKHYLNVNNTENNEILNEYKNINQIREYSEIYLSDSNSEQLNSVEVSSKKIKTYNDKRKKYKISKKYICETCNTEYNNQSELTTHKKSHIPRRFQCQACQKSFPNRNRLLRHEIIHTGLKKFKCDLCSKGFVQQCNLERHVKCVHSKEKPFVCDKCGQNFARIENLKQHMHIRHSEIRAFSCEICNKGFKQKQSLYYHKEIHKKPLKTPKVNNYIPDENFKEFLYNYGDRKTRKLATNQYRITTNTGENLFECPVCSLKFTQKQSLKRHMLLHTDEKPHKCEVCGTAFSQIGNLNRHKLVHTGGRPHKCNFCSKSFSARDGLITHMRIHTGETPYHCTICDKKFHAAGNLKRHQLVHTKNQNELGSK